jgi:hypothetical protein
MKVLVVVSCKWSFFFSFSMFMFMPHYPNQVFELSCVGFETLFFFVANVVQFSIEIAIFHVGSKSYFFVATLCINVICFFGVLLLFDHNCFTNSSYCKCFKNFDNCKYCISNVIIHIFLTSRCHWTYTYIGLTFISKEKMFITFSKKNSSMHWLFLFWNQNVVY